MSGPRDPRIASAVDGIAGPDPVCRPLHDLPVDSYPPGFDQLGCVRAGSGLTAGREHLVESLVHHDCFAGSGIGIAQVRELSSDSPGTRPRPAAVMESGSAFRELLQRLVIHRSR